MQYKSQNSQAIFTEKVSTIFHDCILKALEYNNTITSLKLPLLLDDAKDKVLRNKVEEINEERKNRGFELYILVFS